MQRGVRLVEGAHGSRRTAQERWESDGVTPPLVVGQVRDDHEVAPAGDEDVVAHGAGAPVQLEVAAERRGGSLVKGHEPALVEATMSG
jgi:hypothetical protein